LLDLVPKIYSVKHKNISHHIKNLLRRLLNTYNAVEKYNLIPKLLKIPFPEDILIREDIIKSIELNPFSYLNIPQEYDVSTTADLDIDGQDIKLLLELASSDDRNKRMWGIYSLSRLCRFDLLSSNHKGKFGEILWSQTNNYHLPSNIEYDYALLSNLLHLPHPEDIDPEMLIRNLLPIQITENEQLGTIGGYGTRKLRAEIIGANPRVDWSSEEIAQILTYLIQWWDQEKIQEKIKIPSIYAPMKLNLPTTNYIEYLNLVFILTQVLVRVVFPNIQENIADQERTIISNLVTELDEYKVPHTYIKAAGLNILNIDKSSLLSEVKTAILTREDTTVSHRNEAIVGDGLHAILLLMRRSAELNLESTLVNELLCLLVEMIQSKHDNHILRAFEVIKELLKEDSQHFYCNSELAKACLNSLESMIEETELHEQDATSDFHKKLCTRREMAAFAYQLYAFYRRKDEPVPDEITRWKKICSSDKEFAEIRAQWEPDSIGIR